MEVLIRLTRRVRPLRREVGRPSPRPRRTVTRVLQPAEPLSNVRRVP